MGRATRWKVQAIGVLASCLTPAPIVIASRGRGANVCTYVHLSFDDRAALSDMARVARVELAAPDALPLFREHWIDVEANAAHDGIDAADRWARGERASWHNGEGLWLHAGPWADAVLHLLEAYLAAFPPQPSHGCPAKSWGAWTAIRKVVIAAGRPDPAGSWTAREAA